jgi:hypothetical protein|tara:strand:+ start:3871 stop:3975 length:105 start_codon:yes stop_codon:yes gene_type:complete
MLKHAVNILAKATKYKYMAKNLLILGSPAKTKTI